MTGEFFGEEHQTISFNSLKDAKELVAGTVVTGVKPQELWTTQEWIEVKKVMKALNTEREADDVYPTRGYFHDRKLILGDTNTTAIIAMIRGKRVQFTVVGNLPKGQRYTRLKNLYNANSDLFTEFEYS